MNRNTTIATITGATLGYILCLWIAVHPNQIGEATPDRIIIPERVAEPTKPLPELTVEQSKTYNTLLPHFEGAANRIMDRREERIANELRNFSTADIVAMATGKMSAERMKFVSLIVGAIIALVLAAIKAVIIAMIMALIWKYIMAHWLYIALVYVGGVILPAAITARLFSRK